MRSEGMERGGVPTIPAMEIGMETGGRGVAVRVR